MKYKVFFVPTFSKMCFILRCFLRPGSSWRSLSCKKAHPNHPSKLCFPFGSKHGYFILGPLCRLPDTLQGYINVVIKEEKDQERVKEREGERKQRGKRGVILHKQSTWASVIALEWCSMCWEACREHAGNILEAPCLCYRWLTSKLPCIKRTKGERWLTYIYRFKRDPLLAS